jgi:DNA-binding transcriptional MerR regulator
MTAPPRGRSKTAFTYKMKDLVQASGLPRQAIHFYVKEGLLPPGKKTGRNTALYAEEHLARLALIKKLQHERFLPLKAIKAVLDGRESTFTAEQRDFLGEVRRHIEAGVQSAEPKRPIASEVVSARFDLDARDIARAIELGLVGSAPDAQGKDQLLEDDLPIYQLFAEIRRAGFSNELGFTLDEFAFFEAHIERLVHDEFRMIWQRLAHMPPADAAAMIERALPLVHAMLARYHEKKVRDLFSSML